MRRRAGKEPGVKDMALAFSRGQWNFVLLVSGAVRKEKVMLGCDGGGGGEIATLSAPVAHRVIESSASEVGRDGEQVVAEKKR